jgi:type IV pilus assembly protein PilA
MENICRGYRAGTCSGARQDGFTIVELMIVVATINILAVIALPLYQNYTIRSKVSEAMVQLSEAKTTVSERYSTTNIMPTDNITAGLDTPESYDDFEYLKRLEITSTPVPGTIVVTLKIPGSSADNKQIQLVPATTTGPVVWTCEPVADPPGVGAELHHIPANCRG